MPAFTITAIVRSADRDVQTFRIPWEEDAPAPDLIITGDLVTLVLREVMPDNTYAYERASVAYVSEPSWFLAQTKEANRHE